jgi:hypothetical protein
MPPMSGRDKAPPSGAADKSKFPPPAGEPAHDVLAAEAFAVPTADPSLRHAPFKLPEDPSGIAEPHDVLAAEEFAMPATRAPATQASPAARLAAKARTPARIAALAAVALGLLRALRRRRGP